MRTLRRLSRARPVRERRTVQKGYEFEVEGRVIAVDVPRKSAKRPSRSRSPLSCVKTERDESTGPEESDDSNDSTDSDDSDNSAPTLDTILAAASCKVTRSATARRKDRRIARRAAPLRDHRNINLRSSSQKNQGGLIQTTQEPKPVDILTEKVQDANEPSPTPVFDAIQEGNMEDLSGYNLATLFVHDDENNETYKPSRQSKRSASPDEYLSPRKDRPKRRKTASTAIIRPEATVSPASYTETPTRDVQTDKQHEISLATGEDDFVSDTATNIVSHEAQASDTSQRPPLTSAESANSKATGEATRNRSSLPKAIEREEEQNTTPSRPVPSDMAKKMLPSPTFPHFEWLRNFWMEGDERKMQLMQQTGTQILSNCTPTDPLKSELRLWRTMIKLFKCVPHDLFRYGLKLDSTSDRLVETDLWSKAKRGMPKDLADKLTQLLCHPLWDGKIDLLRHALQLAVCYRVENHIPPLSVGVDVTNIGRTIYKAIESIRESAGGDPDDAILGDYHYKMLMRAGVAADKDIKILDKSIRHRVKAEPARYPEERLLFLLRPSDVDNVLQALDSKEHFRPAKRLNWLHSSVYAKEELREIAYDIHSAEILDWKTFLECKVHCCIAEEREKAIRWKLRSWGCPDYLFDIRETDPTPWYYRSDRVTKEQRSVLSGVVYPPWAPPLPSRRVGPDPE